MYKYDEVEDMDFSEWIEDKKRQEREVTGGAEKIDVNHWIYDIFFAINKVCFDNFFDFLPFSWMTPEQIKERPGVIGIHRESRIIVRREFCEKQKIEDVVDLVFHEMVHAFCEWKQIIDTRDGVHLEAYAQASFDHGGERDSSGDLRSETMNKVKAELKKRGL